MTYHDEELDRLLIAANPLAEGSLPNPVDSPEAQRLYRAVTGHSYGGVGRRRRRRWLPQVVAAVTAVGGLGVGGAYALSQNHVTKHLTVLCYSEANTQGAVDVLGVGSAGPVATCAQHWAVTRGGQVPLMVACLNVEGLTAVFPSAPGADVCAQLDLTPVRYPSQTLTQPLTTATTAPPGGLAPGVADGITASLAAGCTSGPDALASVEATLTKAHSSWKAAISGTFTNDRPCASPGFDEDAHVVLLIPRPPAGSS